MSFYKEVLILMSDLLIFFFVPLSLVQGIFFYSDFINILKYFLLNLSFASHGYVLNSPAVYFLYMKPDLNSGSTLKPYKEL